MTLEIIVDTNVFVKARSDKKKKGADNRLINDLHENRMSLVYTPRMESEVEDVLNKCGPSYTFSKKVVLAFHRGTKITDQPNLTVCSDQSDNMFIECAISKNIKYIITYDKELLTLNGYENINIINPSIFYQQHYKAPKAKQI